MVTREALAVLGATLIDGSGGPPLDAATVVVEGERVTAVGPSSTTPVPPGVPTIDGRGRFLMPGLVDMHVHVTWGAEAALAGVDSVEHLNVFGQLAPEGLRMAEPGKLTPFEYGGWLWRWFGDVDPRADHVRRLYDALIAASTALDPTLVLYAARPGALGDDVGDTSMDDPERTRLLPLLPPPVSKELVARWAERRTAARGASETTRGKTRRAWDNMLEIVGGFHR